MTKEDALNVFKQLAAQSRATIQEHQIIQEAIKTLTPEEGEPCPTKD